jgi:hypothetical protein
MKLLAAACTIFALTALTACQSSTEPAEAAWTTLFDGTSLDGWTPVGNAMWNLADGAVTGSATEGNGYLVSRDSYGDFELQVEFWVDEPANSGVFIRCQDTSAITADNAYEVNVYDTRPDPTYRTGSIVNVAPPAVSVNAGGQWNTFEIMAQGPHLVVTLNGMKTVDTMDSKHAMGPIALQYGAGVVKFRSVKIRTL